LFWDRKEYNFLLYVDVGS